MLLTVSRVARLCIHQRNWGCRGARQGKVSATGRSPAGELARTSTAAAGERGRRHSTVADGGSVPWEGAGLLATAAISTVAGRWYYFAYGSNLNSDVFEGRRGVSPLDARPGVLEGYRLAFNMPGLPFVEPSFASVEPSEGDEVHGVVFTLDWNGWLKVCQSEGVPFGYTVEPVAVSLYGGDAIEALTLRTAPSLRFPREAETNPSARYFTLIFHGAMERGLAPEWQRQLQRMVSP